MDDQVLPDPAATELADGGSIETSAHGRKLALSTMIFAAATAISRVVGLGREVLSAYYFGTKGPINAFTVAFQVPNIVRALVADAALSSAFVPVFSELLIKGERKRAWRVASSLFWLMLLGLGALTALFMLVAPLVMSVFGTHGYQGLAVTLSRILFPIVALLGLSGIVVGILNSYEHFSIPALTPVFWNLAIIAGLVIGVPMTSSTTTQLYIYAGSILVGTVIQFLLPLPWLYGLDGRLRPVIDWRDPAVKRVFVLMGPVALGLGLINFNVMLGTIFASRLIDPTIAPTAISRAFLIYMLPQGIFSVAITTVLFPTLSRAAVRMDWDSYRDTFSVGMRQIAFTLVPASVISIVLATPIVRLLYQRGAFTPHQTTVVSACLVAYSVGLAFNGFMLMLNRGFFALQRPWMPTVVALGNLILNALLYFALYRVGPWGVPMAISIANIAGTGALLVLLRRRIGRIDFGQILSSFTRVVAASVVFAAVGYGIWRPLDSLLGRSFPAQLASLGTALLVGIAAYLISARSLGVRELQTLLALRHRRAT
ncbi:MAG: murein biosynthesis integral membrane protein MurJ [Gaiellaceae bacterium]